MGIFLVLTTMVSTLSRNLISPLSLLRSIGFFLANTVRLAVFHWIVGRDSGNLIDCHRSLIDEASGYLESRSYSLYFFL